MSQDRPPHVGHHYESAEQQFQSGKLGMWLFLATEILLFGGLFCAYAVYRANHPEVFVYAHHFLNKTLGAVNTAILICSSFTMALGVRMAQLGRQRALVVSLALTLLCAFGFLGIKYVEYTDKWKHGLLWGERYAPHLEHGDAKNDDAKHGAVGDGDAEHVGATGAIEAADLAGASRDDVTGAARGEDVESTTTPEEDAAVTTPSDERSDIPPAATGPTGLARPTDTLDTPHAASEAVKTGPSNVHLFFGIYFVMTGLHGLHVIAGMVVIAWLIARALKGHFGREYFTPVDLGGLYWHLVDLIWIYLFPLLYLIGG